MRRKITEKNKGGSHKRPPKRRSHQPKPSPPLLSPSDPLHQQQLHPLHRFRMLHRPTELIRRFRLVDYWMGGRRPVWIVRRRGGRSGSSHRYGRTDAYPVQHINDRTKGRVYYRSVTSRRSWWERWDSRMWIGYGWRRCDYEMHNVHYPLSSRGVCAPVLPGHTGRYGIL